MFIWEMMGFDLMTGIDLPRIRVRAESFDEAIEKARMIDPRYDGGFVYDVEEG